MPRPYITGRLRVSGKRHVAFGEGALDGGGALEGATGALEGDHEAIALGLHLEAAVRLHLAPHDGVVLPQHLQPALVAQALVDGRGTLDVAKHDGDRTV